MQGRLEQAKRTYKSLPPPEEKSLFRGGKAEMIS